MFQITIEAARVNAGMHRQEAANKLGVSYPTLRRLETGESSPTKDFIDAICALYDVPVCNLRIAEIKEKKAPRKTRLYRIWSGMKQRCNNPNCNRFRFYGAKGVRVCEEWENSYDLFMQWSLENGYAADLTIDRIDANKDYCPENCRWIPGGLNSSLARRK